MQPLFTIRGKVRHGNKRGKLLGFPTANVFLHRQISEGIYASTVVINKKMYKAATFIGEARTFNEKEYKAETYIFDFAKNIYDKWMTIRLYKKLRGNKKFTSEKALVEQMDQDIKHVKDYFEEI